MKTADRISALVLLGVSVYAWIAAAGFSPLSALFPRVVIVILGSLALLLLVGSLVRPREGRAFALVQGDALPVVLTVVMMVAWVALIGVLGFLTSSLVFFSLMAVLLDRRGQRPLALLRRLGLVCALILAFYFLFERLLAVSFPRGVLL